MKGYLEPLTRKFKSWKVVGFDVEGTGEVGGFRLGCIYDDKGAHLYRSRVLMGKALLSHRYRSCRIYAHNLEYDWGCVFQDDSKGWQLLRLHSRMIKATYRDENKNHWVFMDTANLSGFISLEALGMILGIEKLETPNTVISESGAQEETCELTEEQLGELERYCVRDAEICYHYAKYIQQEVNELGGELKSTLPATSMDIVRRRHLSAPIKTPTKWANDLCRQGYYGGRCEVFRFGTFTDHFQYDIHSMYPACMVEIALPDPAGLYYFTATPKISRIIEQEGMTHCRVLAPDVHLPLLPVRVSQRLLFLTGEFEGAWCHNELRKALELGYKILSIKWQFCTKTTLNPLRDYVWDLYDRKVKAQRAGNPAYFIYKLLMNSLYGKFGQKADGGLTTFTRIDDYEGFQEKVGIDVVQWQENTYIIEEVGGHRQPAYVIVLWAAYITAQARLKEYGLLGRVGDEVVYCDTDCVISPVSLPIDLRLGGIGLERGPVNFEIRAPKYYRWRDDGSDWNYLKAGIKNEFQREFWETGSVRYLRPSKLAESLQTNNRMSRWIVQVKNDRARHFKRCPLSEYWGEGVIIDTRPWTYSEAITMYELAPKFLPWRHGRILTSELLVHEEIRDLRRWQIKGELDALRTGLQVPQRVVFELWDFKVGTWRRVRNKRGQLTLGAYARVDELAQELGYRDGEKLKEVIQNQLRIYHRINELREELKSQDKDWSDEPEILESVPF